MKVIQVMPNFALAGAERMCENLIYGLQQQGIEVIVVSLFNQHSIITDNLEARGVKIIYLDKKLGFDFSIIKKLKKIFKAEKPDVIHTHRYSIEYAIPAAILAGVKKRVHTVHNLAEKENIKKARRLNKLFFKFFHVTPVALSPLIQKSIAKEYNINTKKIPIVFNGIDLSKCQSKKDYNLGPVIRILHIGRFEEQKNHIGLIEAFSLYHSIYTISVLRLIGDGEKKSEIESIVQEKGLKDSVEFLGLQENVYSFLEESDIFTLPSLYEGVPITLIEAMGTGLPIVATCVGGVPNLIESGKEGLLTSSDTKEISQMFVQFTENMELRKSCGQNAKEKSALFSNEMMAKEYIKIYNCK